MLRTRGVGGVMMMMMMMMMMMILVNYATKFRHGMDKFYQPNSGLRGSRSRDEAIYIHVILYKYMYYNIYIYIYTHNIYTYIRIIYIYIHTYIHTYDTYIYIFTYFFLTGRTKVALVELPAVNMFGFFFCAPFSPQNPSMELCRTPVEFPPSKNILIWWN